MGEAARRKANEKFYGTVPKKGMGLVISNPVKIEGTSISGGGPLDPQELRFSLLLWDRLVWPTNNMIHFGGGAEESFLIDSGVLTRPRFTASGYVHIEIPRIHQQAFLDLVAKEPGLWSIAEGERSFQNLNKKFSPSAGSAYELFQAVPVPDRDVPLNELLEFKAKRRDELLALRMELEQFMNKVEKGGDDEGNLRRAVAAIETACVDAIKISREARFPFRLTNVKTSYSVEISKLIGSALLGIAAQGFGMPTLSSLLASAGVALSTGAVSFKTQGDFGLPGNKLKNHPYRYVASYSTALFP